MYQYYVFHKINEQRLLIKALTCTEEEEALIQFREIAQKVSNYLVWDSPHLRNENNEIVWTHGDRTINVHTIHYMELLDNEQVDKLESEGDSRYADAIVLRIQGMFDLR